MLQARYALEPFVLLRKEMDRILEDAASGVAKRRPVLYQASGCYPAFNVWEKDDVYWVEAECPGLSKDSFELSVVGSELTVSGEKKEDSTEGVSYHRRERGVGKFSRTLSLPCEIKADAVQATLRNGVLTIQLPKAESAKPKKITIQS